MRFAAASALAFVMTAAFLSGAGLGSSAAAARGAHEIPTGLAAAIHARLGTGAMRSAWAARSAEEPSLGFSVALSADGTTALVGAPGVAYNTGAVYVFRVSGAGSWSSSRTPTAVLTKRTSPAHVYYSFGFAIALSADGTTAFIGAPGAGPGANPPGAFYVFRVSTEDAWASTSTPKATLTVSGSSQLGCALAVSPDGTTLVAGDPCYTGGAGGAYVFHVSSEGAWASSSTPTAMLNNSGEDPADAGVGSAVAISGDGTTGLLSDARNPSGGAALLYHVSTDDAWTSNSTPTAILSDGSGYPDFYGGTSVALSGDGTVALVAVIGALYVFHASGEAAWASTSTPTATLYNAGEVADDYPGYGAALSTDGTTALMTAPGVDGNRGAVYVFRASGEGAWASSSAPTAALTNSRGRAKDYLGFVPALSANGATALVGAPGVRAFTGAAEVFHVSHASSWASSSTPTAILAARCVVPRLKGLMLSAAKSRLKARSCRLGSVRTVVQPNAKKGRVVSQSRKQGSRLPVGTKVALQVAK